MTLQPFQLARYGVYLALALAAISVFLAHNAGNALDVALMRALLVFVFFTAIAFGAEAVIHSAPAQAPARPSRQRTAEPEHETPEHSTEGEAE